MKHEQPEPIGGGRFAKMTIVVDCDGDAELKRCALEMTTAMESLFRLRCAMLLRAGNAAPLSQILLQRDDDCGCR